MALSKIISSSIATDAVGPTQLNEAANYDFTGTVTGTPTGLNHFQVFNRTSDQSISSDTATTITWSGESSHQPSVGSTLVSQSSGIFSFSATGIYMINASISVQMNANDGHSRKANLIFQKTTNNSSYVNEAVTETSIPNTDGGELNKGFLTGNFLVDITNTTNDKIKFLWYLQSNPCSIKGETGEDKSIVQFAKIAET
jgi:hypothetical protein